jgi:UDP-N-acetylmuramate: L-alanyl-gamma-D-glutamyl-meso-diaminopimelate ligase
VPRNGKLIVNGTAAALERVLARGAWSEIERFDVAEGWHADDISEGERHCFDVAFGSRRFGRVDLPEAGAHNRSNALAAIAAARHVGVAPELAIQALAQFSGVKRRLEMRGERAGVKVYDDFAHHPTAIETTVAGLRRRIGTNTRILAVLEARSNTMRLGSMNALLPASLREADLVFCYGARAGKNALGWEPAEVLAPLGERAACFDRIDAIVEAVAAAARVGDHVLVMSNGGFGGVHQKLLDALSVRAQRPRPA